MSIRQLIFYTYKKLVLWEISIRRLLLGFENVKCRLRNVDNRLITPILQKYGASVGEGTIIDSHIIINGGGSDFSHLRIGRGSYIGKNVLIDLHGNVDIGNNATISMGTQIISHFDVGKSALNNLFKRSVGKVFIGDHCYIGAQSVLLNNVTLGEYCVVGAKSLVRDSFDERSLIAGIPAKFKKSVGKSNGSIFLFCGHSGWMLWWNTVKNRKIRN